MIFDMCERCGMVQFAFGSQMTSSVFERSQMKSLKTSLTSIALVALTTAFSATPVGAAPTPPAHVAAILRLVKPDGVNVMGQTLIATEGTAMRAITLSNVDAFAMVNGRCAFKAKFDEISTTRLTNVTNRIYSNGTLVAQRSQINLAPGAQHTIWSIVSLFPGANNVKVVLNADSPDIVVGWLRVNVTGGMCGAPPPPPLPFATIYPGSQAWNQLLTAMADSRAAYTQLAVQFPPTRYGEAAAALNAEMTRVVNTEQRIEKAAFDSLMARWSALTNDPGFKEGMLPGLILPGTLPWNDLITAMGDSRYAYTQLVARPQDLRYGLAAAALNAEMSRVVNTEKRMGKAAYVALMTHWTALSNDPGFKEAMEKVIPSIVPIRPAPPV